MIWIIIVLCLAQSAIFSGLNLGFLGMSRLRLEIQAQDGDRTAKSLLSLRQDNNRMLATILWGNVAINALLAFVCQSAIAGLVGFVFTTVIITLFGERSEEHTSELQS